MTSGPLSPGDIVAGKYRIERLLGTGATGIVFAAQHLQLNQRVALKFLNPTFADDPTITARFLREAQAAARIQSEHVARVSDVSSLESGQLYIVMEFLEGRDLAALLAGGARLEVATAVGYVLQAAEAIAHAHANGIIHRDLKPANVFLAVREDGSMSIKVLDFGISKWLGTTSHSLTVKATGLGSPAYMSPEQIRSAKDVDLRTDIWALGVILFSLLTGHGPFEEDNLNAVFQAIIHRATPSPRDKREDVPPGLEAVVLRCLQKSPDERYANVGELARALEPFGPASVQGTAAKIERILGTSPNSSERKASSRGDLITAPATVVEITRGMSPPSHAAGPPLGAVIHVLGGPATPTTFQLSSGSCRAGSGTGCDIVINEPTVSRVHVELTLRTEGVEVQDLGSTNGTFYLGQRVQRMVLSLGARIQIGLVTLVLDADRDQLEHVLRHSETSYRGLLGASDPMRRLFGMLARLEASLTPVILEGEPGTGKEAVARALHDGSSVSGGPLITINCAALPRELAASELFGHKRNALPGAVEERMGAFEHADEGTLFLDEICDLPLDVQPMVLQAMESGEVRRVGGDTAHQVRVRVIASTSRDLAEEVRQGRLREELYFRIAVVRLRVPPLRDRIEDIPALVEKFAIDAGVGALPQPIVEDLKTRAWPGNVRELRDTVLAYDALGALPELTRPKGAILDLALRKLIDPRRPYEEQKAALVDRFTAIWLEELLELTAGNHSAAARFADLDRAHIAHLATQYGIGKSPRSR
ncbi:sigma 54-interacting transcriptional regulator [Pendulispora rubella]|uniref:Sigma 54-interacting transcriptional regulator n=1 Tax=Pendulispora rubella TaxID=2741070 RepID=A0ABZ2LFB2_9BACT